MRRQTRNQKKRKSRRNQRGGEDRNPPPLSVKNRVAFFNKQKITTPSNKLNPPNLKPIINYKIPVLKEPLNIPDNPLTLNAVNAQWRLPGSLFPNRKTSFSNALNKEQRRLLGY